MPIFIILLQFLSVCSASFSFAQSHFGLTPAGQTAIHFQLAKMKRNIAEISPELLEIKKRTNLKGLTFTGQDTGSNYEIAFLNLKVRTGFTESATSAESESITCAAGDPRGVYSLKSSAVGFNTASKDTDFRFMDANNRICYFKASSAFLRNIHMEAGSTVLLIRPAFHPAL